MKEFMPLILISYTILGRKKKDVQAKKVFSVSLSTVTMIWAADIKLYIDWRNIKLYTACKSLIFVT